MKAAQWFVTIVGCFFALSVLATDPPNTQTTPEWVKLTVPTDAHTALKDFTGKWNYTMTWKNTPTDKVESSKGTSTNKMIMGGRFLQQEVKAKIQGKEFVGMGLTGYDTMRQEYQSIWLDNMSTHIMNSTGTMDTATNVLKESGTMACAMTGNKNRAFRSELKKVSKNEHVFAMFTPAEDGAEFKMMEITYKRAAR